MEEEREEGGITIGYIFRTIFSQKWLALALVIAITVAGTLGFYFFSNTKKEYVTSFSITLPDANETDSFYKYPDGNRFYYVNLTSSKVLENVKNGNPEFSDINVSKIIKDGISIEEKIETLESSEKDVVLVRRSFELRISAKSFKDIDKALAFVTELVNFPVNLYYTMDINHNVYLNKKDFNEALTFETQIDYIQSQIDYLNSHYNSLINITDEEGNSVESKRQQFNAWVWRTDLPALLTEASANYYLKDWEVSISKFKSEKLTLLEELADANKNLTNVQNYLKENNVQSDDVASVIADLQSKVTVIDRKIETIENYINKYEGSGKEQHIAETSKFAEKIQKVYDELTGDNGFIAVFTDLSKSVYEKEAAVSFFEPNIIKVDSGGWGLTKSLLISFVLAIIVAAIVAYIVGWSKQRKALKALEVNNEAPVQVQKEAVKAEAADAEAVQSEESKK